MDERHDLAVVRGQVIVRPVEVSDLVEALQAEGVGEVVEPLGSMTFGPIVTVDDYGPHLVVHLGEDAE